MQQPVKYIPVSIARMALKKCFVRELMLYVRIKSMRCRHFYEGDLAELFEGSGIKVWSTFEKQLEKLIKSGAVGRSGDRYFVRGWEEWGKSLGVEDVRKRIAYGGIDGIIEMRAFLFSGVVGYEVKKIRHYYEKTEEGQISVRLRGRNFRVIDRRGEVKHRFGLKMERVSDLFGFTRAYVVRMKRDAEKFGYLVSRKMATWWGCRMQDEMLFRVEFRTKKSVALMKRVLGGV